MTPHPTPPRPPLALARFTGLRQWALRAAVLSRLGLKPAQLPAAALDPLSLVRHDKVLMTVGAVKMIEERLQ